MSRATAELARIAARSVANRTKVFGANRASLVSTTSPFTTLCTANITPYIPKNESIYSPSLSQLRCFSTEPVTKLNETSIEDDDEEEHPPGWELIHCPPTKGKYPRGSLVGTVVSDKMQKTVNVSVDRFRIVPKYRKRMRYTRKFMAHDEEEQCNVGDVVLISPSQKLSKKKHFTVQDIIRRKPQL